MGLRLVAIKPAIVMIMRLASRKPAITSENVDDSSTTKVKVVKFTIPVCMQAFKSLPETI